MIHFSLLLLFTPHYSCLNTVLEVYLHSIAQLLLNSHLNFIIYLALNNTEP